MRCGWKEFENIEQKNLESDKTGLKSGLYLLIDVQP